ncbi:MAG: biopolymer transporter ExbD [Nannocystaceae bacterium]|nr:biopolymer transporter ExbD [Nannocystaceae bacterium]
MGMSIGSENGKTTVKPDMNVTPLVDVVLVLLIIFMVLAPVVTEGFDVRLPPKDETDQRLDASNDPSQPLVLSVTKAGTYEVNAVGIEQDELPGRLKRMFNARPNTVLYVDGADDAAYGQVLQGVDAARTGGAAPVVMVTKKLE